MMAMVKAGPGAIRKIAPKKAAKVTKIPSDLQEKFKDTIKQQKVDIAVEKGDKNNAMTVYAYEEIMGSLGQFLNNPPHTSAQKGRNVGDVAEEAFKELIETGEEVVGVVVDRGLAITYKAGSGLIDIASREVECFVVDTVGKTVIRELENFGNTVTRELDNFGRTISRELDNFGHTISREADNFCNTVGTVVNDVGGFFKRLF